MAGDMITKLQAIVQDRHQNSQEGSYTNQLFDKGMTKIAQKVGEEGVEVTIAALVQDDDLLLGEVADLIYHCTVLLIQRGLTWEQVETVLERRHAPKEKNSS